MLQIDPLRGGTKRMVEGYVSGACGFVRPLTPTAVGVGAFWVATGATCDATATYSLSAAPHAVDDVPDPASCEGTACTIMRAPALRWRDRTPGRPFGPHPG